MVVTGVVVGQSILSMSSTELLNDFDVEHMLNSNAFLAYKNTLGTYLVCFFKQGTLFALYSPWGKGRACVRLL